MQKISTHLYTHTVAALGAKDDWNQGRRRGVTNLRHAESEAWGSWGMGRFAEGLLSCGEHLGQGEIPQIQMVCPSNM